MATAKTVQDVLDRARSNLNDSEGRLWTDEKLLPKLANAYGWLYSAMAKYEPSPVRKVKGQPYNSDIVYVANTVDITSTLPADIYLPERLEYRLVASDDWIPMDRVTVLPTQMEANPATPTQWCWFNRKLMVNAASSNALLRLTYLSLFADLADVGDSLAMDNVVEALAYYVAFDAYGSRGQVEQAKWAIGTPPLEGAAVGTGALGFLELVLDHLVLTQQLLPRRGQEYSAGAPWGVGQAQIFPTT